MLRGENAVGAISIRRLEVRQPFSDKQIALLQTFADQAVIAIENTRLFNETKDALHKVEERTDELTEALEYQTAISEVLRVISDSPTDVAPVLEVILDCATRLFQPQTVGIFRYDGRLIHVAATRNWTPEVTEQARTLFPMPPDERSITGRVILARTTMVIDDTLDDPQYGLGSFAKAGGWRRLIGAPMLKDGVPVGVINVCWPEPGQTPQRQIALLQTFADQAVIAIENTRLFNELRHVTRTASLEQQTATSEILRVISQSQRDVQPVFDTIASNARKLCRPGIAGEVFMFDGELSNVAAVDSVSPEMVESHPRNGSPAKSRQRGSAGYPHPRRGLHPGCARGPGISAAIPCSEGRVSQRRFCPDASRRQPNRCGRRPGRRTCHVHGATDRDAADLRRPGGDRDREHAAVQRARARNRDLTESLAQQTATSEILRVISAALRKHPAGI